MWQGEGRVALATADLMLGEWLPEMQLVLKVCCLLMGRLLQIFSGKKCSNGITANLQSSQHSRKLC